VRLRLLLPRRRRGRGLGRLTRGGGAVLALAVAGCASGHGPAPSQPPPAAPETVAAPTATPTGPRLADLLERRGKHLAVGITEQNPNLISADPGIPQPFARWRDELARMRPALYRVIIYWPPLQPRANAPADLAGINGGCLRDKRPCAAYAGIRDELRALATRQRQGDAQGFAIITGTPAWAARPPSGCEGRKVEPTNRMPRTDALPAYERLVRDVLALSEREGATLRYWAPWNEPNHPYSSSPQRAYCSGSAPTVSVPPYLEVAAALRRALADAPGEQRYVVGEVAVMTRHLPTTTSVHEFLQALPANLVCGAAAWTQHTYIGGRDALADVDDLLASKRCGRKLPIWVTETAAGAPRTSGTRTGGRPAEVRGCRDVHRALTRWYRDARVSAAIQYTLREDDVFPTGLVTTDLSRAYPVLHEWQQWGMRARPSAEDVPPATAVCG
jgi:hypothetical protein